jgi:hypothetical protein
MKVVAALDSAGIELIGDGAISQSGGRGVRLKAMGAGLSTGLGFAIGLPPDA